MTSGMMIGRGQGGEQFGAGSGLPFPLNRHPNNQRRH
jgi:hypothetical protein